MQRAEPEKSLVAHGPIIQVAWAVEDIAAAESLWGASFGVSWARIPDVQFGPDSCTMQEFFDALRKDAQ